MCVSHWEHVACLAFVVNKGHAINARTHALMSSYMHDMHASMRSAFAHAGGGRPELRGNPAVFGKLCRRAPAAV